MPLSRSDKARLLLGFSLLAPMLTVQLMRMTMGGGPVTVPAATTTPSATASAVSPQSPDNVAALLAAAKPLTAAQVKASEYLTARTPAAEIKSPMDHPTVAAPTTDNPNPEDEPVDTVKVAPTEDPDPASKLVVTGIFADRTMSCASINNSLRKVGDEVVFGWTITQIDGKRGVVVLTSKSGKTLEFSPKH